MTELSVKVNPIEFKINIYHKRINDTAVVIALKPAYKPTQFFSKHYKPEMSM